MTKSLLSILLIILMLNSVLFSQTKNSISLKTISDISLKAKNGDSQSQYFLSGSYYFGEGVPIDKKKADYVFCTTHDSPIGRQWYYGNRTTTCSFFRGAAEGVIRKYLISEHQLFRCCYWFAFQYILRYKYSYQYFGI